MTNGFLSDVKGHRGKQHIFTSQLNSWATVRIIFLHLSPNKFSSACNLLCRITCVSCVTLLTAHYKHWNWFGVVSSLPLKWWKCKRHITQCSSALQEAGERRWIYCSLLLGLIWYYSWLVFKILLLRLKIVYLIAFFNFRDIRFNNNLFYLVKSWNYMSYF